MRSRQEKNFVNKKVFSRWRKVDNDSADVTSSGRRSFDVRGPTTGKARLVGDGCQLNRRHCRTIGAKRTERSASR